MPTPIADPSGPQRARRPLRRVAASAAAVATLATWIATSALPVGASPRHGARKHSGEVVVLSAGSLETIMKTAVGPGFHRATGYTVTDISGGSTGLAQDIKGGVHRADVFWSASATSDKAIEGKANGNWVRWYITFAATPLVLGYNASSKFAATLVSGPWWKVVSAPGVLVGRTNPVTDPKGRLTVTALKAGATKSDDPALAAIATKATTVFTETTLVGRLQSGQLDVGFFYAVEASAAHFPTVPLEGVHEVATYTLTVVAKAPHRTAAAAFVKWLLSPEAKRLLAADGLHELRAPTLSGERSAVPRSLKKVIH
ncbi:MAG TPA: extracellular solute-binding protein [Acidimicrobiales bacterium]|nr:extracellular solute-binding protein [Acidimicrobiales bacterium]